MKAPTSYEIMEKYLNQEKNMDYIAVLKKRWLEYDVTIMCDGWIDPTR